MESILLFFGLLSRVAMFIKHHYLIMCQLVLVTMAAPNQNEPIFPHDALPNDNTPPYPVW